MSNIDGKFERLSRRVARIEEILAGIGTVLDTPFTRRTSITFKKNEEVEMKSDSLSRSTSSVKLVSDPPQNTSAPVLIGTFVLDLVLKLLEDYSRPKQPLFISKFIKNSGPLRNLFADRNLKAIQKYKGGLRLEDKTTKDLTVVCERLADIVFFLTKFKESRDKNMPLTADQIKDVEMIKDLHKILVGLLQDFK